MCAWWPREQVGYEDTSPHFSRELLRWPHKHCPQSVGLGRVCPDPRLFSVGQPSREGCDQGWEEAASASALCCKQGELQAWGVGTTEHTGQGGPAA